MSDKGNERWDPPLRPEPAVTRKDYYVLLGVVALVVLIMATYCGIGLFVGETVFW